MAKNENMIIIQADISPDSVASAARAFQVLMALQDMGKVISINPSVDIIETAAPIHHLEAIFVSNKPIEDIRNNLSSISEIDNLEITTSQGEALEPTIEKTVSTTPVKPETAFGYTLDIPPGTELIFEISDDEYPIFIAESDEQLQVLDEGLVQIEQLSEDEDLIQAVFRAAHTLKGAAGMINHKRMVEVTHALESALDGLRKRQFGPSSELIDLCLEAVDAIRTLSGEVSKGKASDIEVEPLVYRFEKLKSLGPESQTVTTPIQPPFGDKQGSILIQASISPSSIASAARALQIVLALREMGSIVYMEPDQSHIDRAAPVLQFKVHFIPSSPIEEVQTVLRNIDEIDKLTIGNLTEIKPSEASIEGEAPRTIPSALQQIQSQGANPDKNTRSTRQSEKIGEQTVRTSVERLDSLMNLVGELITDRNRIYQLRTDLEIDFRGDESVEHLSTTITHIGRITDQLQTEVMRIRMQPISSVFNKLPRLVRDLARKANKEINLIMRGEDTELDRSVIENINDPLIHLLRNSVDHGIELSKDRLAVGKPSMGTITVAARHEEGHIVITVEDDGQGINVDRVKNKAVEKGLMTSVEAASMPNEQAIDLIFASGLSTAKTVSDISGRGVGMDIVRNNIEQLNGSVQVETWSGRGTQFQIILPLTLAIVPTLLVQVGMVKFAIPLGTITQTLRVPVDTIKTVNQRPVITLRGSVLPLAALSKVFNFPSNVENADHVYVVVVRWGKSDLGIIVDKLIGEQELVVKSLSSLLGETPGIASAAILGDGQVSLIVDVKGLFSLAGMQQYRH